MKYLKPKNIMLLTISVSILILILILILIILWNTVLLPGITEEDMITKMNTSENVQLMSKVIDNPDLLLSSPYAKFFVVYTTKLKNKREFLIKIDNGTKYHFVKYEGLYICFDDNKVNCSNMTEVTLERQKIRIFYHFSDTIIRTVKQNMYYENKRK